MPGNVSIISGIVRDSLGHPLAGARITVAEGPVPLQEIAMLTGEDGSFSVTAPVAGTYRITCHAEGFSPQSHTVLVANAARATLNFQMQKGKQ